MFPLVCRSGSYGHPATSSAIDQDKHTQSHPAKAGKGKQQQHDKQQPAQSHHAHVYTRLGDLEPPASVKVGPKISIGNGKQQQGVIVAARDQNSDKQKLNAHAHDDYGSHTDNNDTDDDEQDEHV